MTRITDICDTLYERRYKDDEELFGLLVSLIEEPDPQPLFDYADAIRKKHMGDGILVRGIVEFSNRCRNSCTYCGLNRDVNIKRYTLDNETILDTVDAIYDTGIRTVVMQSGEYLFPTSWLGDVIAAIKSRHPDMAVTLSCGEREKEDYAVWKAEGADRYLIKIETADPKIYAMHHPGMSLSNRIQCVHDLNALGYQTGSGILVGLPGQTPETFARDIVFLVENNIHMSGTGPFIAHPDTCLADCPSGDPTDVFRLLALTRILIPNCHLPATTALEHIADVDYRVMSLQSGANVVMLNFTPQIARDNYVIYPKKTKRSPQEAVQNLKDIAASIDRHVDFDIGHAAGF